MSSLVEISLQRIVSLQRHFLWGGGLEGNKLAWVKWEKICTTKEAGGLGIKFLWLFDVALLSK